MYLWTKLPNQEHSQNFKYVCAGPVAGNLHQARKLAQIWNSKPHNSRDKVSFITESAEETATATRPRGTQYTV